MKQTKYRVVAFLKCDAEHFCFVETPVPLSAISFYSALLHKKDVAAIGAILEASVFRGKFSKQTIVNEYDVENGICKN